MALSFCSSPSPSTSPRHGPCLDTGPHDVYSILLHSYQLAPGRVLASTEHWPVQYGVCNMAACQCTWPC